MPTTTAHTTRLVVMPDGAVNADGETLVRRWTVTTPGHDDYLIDLTPFGEYQVFRAGEYVTAVGTLALAVTLCQDLDTFTPVQERHLTGYDTALVPIDAVQPEQWRTIHTDAPLRAVRAVVTSVLDLTLGVQNELVNVGDPGLVTAWVPATRETAVVDVLLHGGYQVTVTDADATTGRTVYHGNL